MSAIYLLSVPHHILTARSEKADYYALGRLPGHPCEIFIKVTASEYRKSRSEGNRWVTIQQISFSRGTRDHILVFQATGTSAHHAVGCLPVLVT